MKPETIQAIKQLAKNKYPSSIGKNFELFAKQLLKHPEILALEGYHKIEWVSTEDRKPTLFDCIGTNQIVAAIPHHPDAPVQFLKYYQVHPNIHKMWSVLNNIPPKNNQ